MSDDASGKPKVEVGFFNLEDLLREKQLAREKDDADLREGRITTQELRLRNGLFSGINFSQATIRIESAKRNRLR